MHLAWVLLFPDAHALLPHRENRHHADFRVRRFIRSRTIGYVLPTWSDDIGGACRGCSVAKNIIAVHWRTLFLFVLLVTFAIINIVVIILAGQLEGLRGYFTADSFALCMTGNSAIGATGGMMLYPSDESVRDHTVSGILALEPCVCDAVEVLLRSPEDKDVCLVAITNLAPMGAGADDLEELMPSVIAPVAQCLVHAGDPHAKLSTSTHSSINMIGEARTWKNLAFRAKVPVKFALSLDRRDTSSIEYALPTSILEIVATSECHGGVWAQLVPCDWGVAAMGGV